MKYISCFRSMCTYYETIFLTAKSPSVSQSWVSWVTRKKPGLGLVRKIGLGLKNDPCPALVWRTVDTKVNVSTTLTDISYFTQALLDNPGQAKPRSILRVDLDYMKYRGYFPPDKPRVIYWGRVPFIPCVSLTGTLADSQITDCNNN